ncbi:MAG: nicotinate phosphoribosyltransferase, partial [Gammaproteobacteria bacterium]
YRIAELLAAGAPIDSFGVGTDLSTSRDAPALGGVYKLVEVEMPDRIEPKMKLSRDKVTYPYRKQVWREVAEDGSFEADVVAVADESGLPGEPLLVPVMRDGLLSTTLPGLSEAQARARQQLVRLPARYKALREATPYSVRHSPLLEQLQKDLLRQLASPK